VSLRRWPDWVAIVAVSLVWAGVGLVLLDLFPGEGQATAISIGWLISYVSLMGWLSGGRRDLAGLLGTGCACLALLVVIAYVVAVMLGLDGGIPN